MSMDLTWYNALVDDDGSGLTGTIWNKARIAEFITAIDAEITKFPAGWGPADASGAGLTLTNNGSYFVVHGRLVWVCVNVTYPATADGSAAKISLPVAANASIFSALAVGYNNLGGAGLQALVRNGTSTVEIYIAGAARTNANLATGNLIATGWYAI